MSQQAKQQPQTSQSHSEPDDEVPSCSSANSQRIRCKRCNSVVLNVRVGRLVVDKPFDVPLPYQRNERRADENIETERLTEWWCVPSVLSFDNVGFTHRHNGRQYLACADCEMGPIGLLNVEDGKDQYLIARKRTVEN